MQINNDYFTKMSNVKKRQISNGKKQYEWTKSMCIRDQMTKILNCGISRLHNVKDVVQLWFQTNENI